MRAFFIHEWTFLLKDTGGAHTSDWCWRLTDHTDSLKHFRCVWVCECWQYHNTGCCERWARWVCILLDCKDVNHIYSVHWCELHIKHCLFFYVSSVIHNSQTDWLKKYYFYLKSKYLTSSQLLYSAFKAYVIYVHVFTGNQTRSCYC